MIKKYGLPMSCLLMVCSCTSPPSTSNRDNPIASNPSSPITGKRCPATMPKDVHLWINAMPGPSAGNGYSMHAAFIVTTPTPGYQFALKVNRVLERFPEQVVLDLIVTKPGGMVIQVVTENKVNIKLDDFPGSEGSSVQVNCEGVPLLKVDKVMAVH